MKNGPQQAVHFGGRCRHTIHYIGVPVGHHALSKSGSSPFSQYRQARAMCSLINLLQVESSRPALPT